jgi:hypothetical protein
MVVALAVGTAFGGAALAKEPPAKAPVSCDVELAQVKQKLSRAKARADRAERAEAEARAELEATQRKLAEQELLYKRERERNETLIKQLGSPQIEFLGQK